MKICRREEDKMPMRTVCLESESAIPISREEARRFGLYMLAKPWVQQEIFGESLPVEFGYGDKNSGTYFVYTGGTVKISKKDGDLELSRRGMSDGNLARILKIMGIQMVNPIQVI
ncbi:MAG: hypothetical protein PHH00_01720 [Candidatus Nanoarchaeia archaeon]|nr:hypothetical protein [Candidatus Nanoarchaeia archaeon]